MCPAGMCSNVNEIHRSIKALDCSKPVLKTVKLRPPAPNFAIVPSVAQVKRCAGHCNHPRSCLPSKTSTIRIPVRINIICSKYANTLKILKSYFDE